MIFILPETLSTFVGNRSIALANGYIEITETQYAKLLKGELTWKDNKLK